MLRSSAAVAPVKERDPARAKPPAVSVPARLFAGVRAIVSLLPWDHAGFRRAPVRCLLRLLAWRLRCFLSWSEASASPGASARGCSNGWTRLRC